MTFFDFTVQMSISGAFILVDLIVFYNLFKPKERQTKSFEELEAPLLGAEAEASEEKEESGEKAKEEDDKVNFRETMGELFKLVWVENKLLFLGAVACLLLAAGGEIGIPHYTGLVIDAAIRADDASFSFNLVCLIVSAVISAAFSAFR